MPYTQLNNLDFIDIKTALKDYMRAQTDFTDYDFEGSAISQLLDVLAYNTYYTAFNTNMVVNELFLDSASLRDNVVSLAKQLGYSPKSKTAPKASVNLSLTFNNSSPVSVTIKAGSGFLTNYDGSLYRFIVTEDYKEVVTNGTVSFANLPIYEGSLITSLTTVDSSASNQRFIIDNPSTDISTLKVRVYESINSTESELYIKANNILDVTSDDKVYFVNEIEDEKYEIFFGDGVLGKKLEDNQVIELSAVVTNGNVTNGASTFRFNGTILNESNSLIQIPYNVTELTVIQNALGGADIESVDNIKYNAPKFYGSQNRAVTSNDFASIVRNIYPSVSDIIVFGGEDQVPPAYGKVFLSIKPTDAPSISSFTKNELTNELKKYTVASIKPEFVDPSILYLSLIHI